MWLKDMFANRRNAESKPEERDPMVNRGVLYVYSILGAQVVLVFGILLSIMVIGKVLATPLWVFLAAAIAGVWGFVFIYRKTMKQLHKIREAVSRMDLSDRNYEISFMGGVLTMRVEQNSHAQALLEAPPKPAILEAEPIDSTVTR